MKSDKTKKGTSALSNSGITEALTMMKNIQKNNSMKNLQQNQYLYSSSTMAAHHQKNLKSDAAYINKLQTNLKSLNQKQLVTSASQQQYNLASQPQTQPKKLARENIVHSAKSNKFLTSVK